MSNISSNPLAETPATGQILDLFELPDKGVGDDRRAICTRQNPLHRPGTPARIQFDLANQMTIEVRFKIYTKIAVNMNIPTPTNEKVGAGKKTTKSAKLNLIESRAINSNYFEISSCLFGKTLNKFKSLIIEACERYEGGMKLIILNHDLRPELKWKTTVGRSKHVLDDATQWQGFVSALEKSVKKQGLLVIENANVEIHVTVETKASSSATKMLIATVNRGETDNNDAKQSDKDAELHIMANSIFSQAGIGGYAGGDGTVLTVPWNPAFRYRLTYTAAWIWAKGVMDKIATQFIPPNTREYNEEIKKSEWKHPNMGVDARVQMRILGHPRKLQPVLQFNPSSSAAGGSTGIINSSKGMNSNPDFKDIGKNRIIDLTNDNDSKPNLKNHHLLSEPIEMKPDLKRIKVEEGPGNSCNDSISVSSDSESNLSDIDHQANELTELPSPKSKIEEFNPHSEAMERFLADCDVPNEDFKTRSILRDAGIISWTDLIPSLQMTESTLTSKGIERSIASCLMHHAQACYSQDDPLKLDQGDVSRSAY
ncbi:hypothetical protein DFH28DRAFT_1085053 [Melampsora americana]|nr:hypothetical protein DFH28DRAFT_1085053 [Melampsora americana]